jgi:hypothetical protein
MTTSLPSEWAAVVPLEIYETQFFSVGLSRYDTTKKTLSSLVRTGTGRTVYTERPCTDTVLARCYVSEFATVTVYSHSPRVWTEDVGADGFTVFVQHQPTQVA